MLITAVLSKLNCTAVMAASLPYENNDMVRIRCSKPRLVFGVSIHGTRGPCTIRFHRRKLQSLRKSKVNSMNEFVRNVKTLCMQFVNEVY